MLSVQSLGFSQHARSIPLLTLSTLSKHPQGTLSLPTELGIQLESFSKHLSIEGIRLN